MKLMKGDEPKRRTEDLDVAIAIDNWQMFDNVCRTLLSNNFTRCGNSQKFIYNNDFEVDIVPFGGVAVDEKIGWPPEGNPVMSVKCFQDVMREAITLNIDDIAKLKIAPLCGQFLIKLDTWNDRNSATDKDAEDMLFILKNYWDTKINAEITEWPDVLSEDVDNVDTIILGARWLAYDLCKMLSTDHLLFYVELIENELRKEEDSNLVYHFMKYFGYKDVSDPKNYIACMDIWSNIGRILSKELKTRNRK
ncbi:MAG: hypothetical protein MJZ61_02180 [Bacteroidales bacterium]|nr:hypothetical protein [Bacteroidales bacterium]